MWKYTGQRRPDFAQEPGPGQESVWDYPRPPALVADTRHVRVSLGNTLLADTTSALRVLETASPPTFYLPPSDVQFDLLVEVSGQSFCEWKGAATYLASRESAESHAIAWAYLSPSEAFARLAGYIAFYPSRADCFVDGERVRAQAGEFYGGWVTDEIVGPFKGDPATGHW